MSDIIVCYSKEQKNTARKLVSKLESGGYSCWIDSRDIEPGTDKLEAFKKQLEIAKIQVIIFSSISDKSSELTAQYDLAFEHELSIIPFIVSDVELTVSMQHFLNTHDWINAFDCSFDEAASNLIQLIQEDNENDIQKTEIKPKKNSTKSQTSTKVNPKQKNLIIGSISVLVLIIIGIFLFYPDSKTEKSEDMSTEELIVGNWKLTNYEDNMQRTPEEVATLATSIETLKQNVSLSFFEDNSFERIGFQPQPEKGNWNIDEQTKTLILTSLQNPDKGGDALLVEEISSKKMILVVAEVIGDKQQVITKLTFEKK